MKKEIKGQVTVFTMADVGRGHIYLNSSYPHKGVLYEKELQWGRVSASGYGAKMPSDLMIYFEGKLRRIYITCYGNAGSSWFLYKGEKIHVS